MDAKGWATFGHVKMPDYRWGIFLADRQKDRTIGFGDFKGRPVWQQVPSDYRSILRRLIVTQGDTEPASVEQQRMLAMTAPSLYDMRNLFQVNVEEARGLTRNSDEGARMSFVDRRSITVEWGDCDPAGIVSYPRFFAFFDAASAALLEAATGLSRASLISEWGIVGWPMVDSRASFRAPVSFDDRIEIVSRIADIGRSSFEVDHLLTRGNTECIVAAEVRVWTKQAPNGLVSAPLPKKVQDALQHPTRNASRAEL